MKYQLVIFDMDGLMFNTEALCMRVMQKVYAKHGYEMPESLYLELVGSNGIYAKRKMHEFFGEDFPVDTLDQETGIALNEAIETEGLEKKKGLDALLTYLKQQSIKLCIASSSSRKRVSWYLEIAGMKDVFDFLVTLDDVKEAKPNPEIFLKALDKGHVQAYQALVLEDSKNGILASHEAGIDVICVPDLKKHSDDINALCTHVLDDLNQVIDTLKATCD